MTDKQVQLILDILDDINDEYRFLDEDEQELKNYLLKIKAEKKVRSQK